jgi:hypothetical protein
MSSTFTGQPVASVADDDGPGGWMLFASIMILMSGLFNAFEGLIGFFRSTYFIGKPIGGDYWIWALLWLAFGIVEVIAGLAVLSGRAWARWFGIVLVSLNAMLNLFAIGIYPWWALTVIVFDVLILYGLTAGWRRVTLAA